MRNSGKLSRLGLFEALEDRRMLATVTAELWSVPASVNPGQLSNVTVRVKYGNDGNDGPWQVKQLDLRESDPAFVYQNISERNNPFYINSQNAWHYYTFYNVNLGAYDDGGNGIELYVYAQVDDNDFNGFSPWDSSPVTNVAYNRPAPPTTPGNITASNVTANSATVSWGRSTDPNGDAISYEVDYKKDFSLFWTSAGTTTSTSRSLTGLEQDSVYDVRVRALDGTFESGWRDQENVITTTTTVTGLAFRSGPSTSSPILSSVRAGGAPVYVHVTAPGMTNGSVEVDVFEDDGIGDDNVGTLTVNVSNGTGYTTWNPVWQGDDADDPNNMYYLGHDCGLLVCETYSGASETGHLRVRTPLQNTINGQAQQIIDQEPVSLSRQDSSAAIDPTATTTWVLAHGWNTSDNEDNGGYLSLANLLDKVEEVRPDDQVLFINWSKPASGLLPVEPEGWIEPVAEWTSSIIDDLGFHPSSLNFIGHSFGSYVAHDTAEQLGGVNSLITIDPAEDPTTALINYNMSAADFGAQANHSWSFYSADDSIYLPFGNEGNEETPTTADEAITVLNSTHSGVKSLFTNMLGTSGGVSDLFQLDRILNGGNGPWVADRYDETGDTGGGYEAILSSTGNNQPVGIEYVSSTTGNSTYISEFVAPPTFEEIVFAGARSDNQVELFQSNGDSDGTRLLKNIGGTQSSNPHELTVVGDTLFFAATGADGEVELFKTTANGSTSRVKDLSGSISSNPRDLIEFDGQLYFSAMGPDGNRELYKSDGTNANSVRVKNLSGTTSSNPEHLTVFNNKLYFAATSDTGQRELYVSDGTAPGTQRVKNLHGEIRSSDPTRLTVLGDTLFFVATTITGGRELHKTDGTNAGTVLVADLASRSPALSSSNPQELTAFNGELYFTAVTPTGSTELYKSDGTDAGTVLVDQQLAPTISSNPRELTVLGNQLVFVSHIGDRHQELHFTDGVTKELLVDLHGATSSSPFDLTVVNDQLYFSAIGNDGERELYLSDGTAAGTGRLKDLGGSLSSHPHNLTAVGDSLYFAATMANHEVELFRSDGTSQGTALVKNLGGSPAPREIVAFEIDALGANDGSGFAFNNQANESVEHVSNTVRTDSVLAIPTGRRTRLDQLPSPTSRVFGIDRDRLSSTRSDLRDGDETSDVTLDVVFSAWN